MNLPVLGLSNFFQLFQIECDALGSAIRSVLLQKRRLISFFGQALKGRELILSTYENELVALVYVLCRGRGLTY